MSKPEYALIEVCHGPRCSDYGGRELRKRLAGENVESRICLCQSLCTYSPVVTINGKALLNATADEIVEQLQAS